MIEIDATFIALVALVIFLAALAYLKVPAMVMGMLDNRSADIAKELNEARRLREEAETLRAQQEKLLAEAHTEADSILANAQVQAKLLADETSAQLKATIARREKMAEERIARAEASASAEVRAAAVEAAVAAAEKTLRERLDAAGQARLVEAGMAGFADKFR